jgi:hypothetical protein
MGKSDVSHKASDLLAPSATKFSQPKRIVPSASVGTNGIEARATYFTDPYKQDVQITGYVNGDHTGLNSIGVDGKYVGEVWNKDGTAKKGKLMPEVGGGVSYERDAAQKTQTMSATPGEITPSGEFTPTGETQVSRSSSSQSGVVANLYGGGYIPLDKHNPNTAVSLKAGAAWTPGAEVTPYIKAGGSVGLDKNKIISADLNQNLNTGDTSVEGKFQYNF